MESNCKSTLKTGDVDEEDAEHIHTTHVLLRLLQDQIITDVEKREIESKCDTNFQKSYLYDLMRKADLKTSTRVFQIIRQNPLRRQMAIETNPMMIDTILLHVFGFLGVSELKQSRLVNQKWNDIADRKLKMISVAKLPKNWIDVNIPEGGKTLFHNGTYDGIEEFLSVFRMATHKMTSICFSVQKQTISELTEFFSEIGSTITKLHLTDINFAEMHSNYDLTPWIVNCPLKELCIQNCHTNNALNVCLDAIKLVQVLFLQNVSVVVTSTSTASSNSKIAPVDLTLTNVSFIVDGVVPNKFNITDAIDFRKINKTVIIDCVKCPYKIVMDFSKIKLSKPIDIDCLKLNECSVENWSECDWVVKTLYLDGVNLVDSISKKMGINHLSFNGKTSLDLAALPSLSIEKLELWDPAAVVICSQPINFQKLQKLCLHGNISSLSHFGHSFKLVELEIHSVEVVNLMEHSFPKTLRKIKMCGINVKREQENENNVLQLDKLILLLYSVSDVLQLTRILQPKLLVLVSNPDANDLAQFLLDCNINFMFVGGIVHETPIEDSDLLPYVSDANPDYFFNNRRGTPVNDIDEFYEFLDLSNDNVFLKYGAPVYVK